MGKIKIVFFTLLALLGYCNSTGAQDTIVPFVDSAYYMFNKRPDNIVDDLYLPWPEDTAQLHPYDVVDHLVDVTTNWGTNICGTLLQSYSPPAGKSVPVVGIAVTMKPYWFDDKDSVLRRGFPDPAGEDCLRYRTVLVSGLENGGHSYTWDTAGIYGDKYKVASILDSMNYDDTTVLRKEVWFNYGTPGPPDLIALSDHLSDDSIAPCIEFYFNKPVGTYTLDSLFYVGTKYNGFADWLNEIRPEGNCNTHIGSMGKITYTSRLNPGEFFRAYRTKDSSDWDYHYIWCRSSLSDNMQYTVKLPKVDRGRWGLVFPIVGFHCKQVPTGLERVDEPENGEVTVRWNDMEDNEDVVYEVRIVYTKKWTDTSYFTTDTTFHFTGLIPGAHYRVQVRRSCRYTTQAYDTLVFSDRWTKAVQFTMPADTTDTTGLAEASGMPFGLQPNPASGSVTLTVADADGGTATLTDLAGREVLQVALAPGRTEHRLDIGALAPGTYLLRLVTPAGTGIRRLLVQ